MDNSMRLKRVKDSLILDLFNAEINSIEFNLQIKYLKKYKNFTKLYINLSNIKEINNDIMQKFYQIRHALQDKEIAIYNVNAMNNCILNLFKVDKIFQIYLNSHDAFEKKYPIINRQFRIVS